MRRRTKAQREHAVSSSLHLGLHTAPETEVGYAGYARQAWPAPETRKLKTEWNRHCAAARSAGAISDMEHNNLVVTGTLVTAGFLVFVRPPTMQERADNCIRDLLAMTCAELQRTGRI